MSLDQENLKNESFESSSFTVAAESFFNYNESSHDFTYLTSYILPNTYEAGQSVTYSASVCNNSNSLASDYYILMSVPTNEYNPLKTSNNNFPAYITKITTTHKNSAIYFRTASSVTANDIKIMQNTDSRKPDLLEYFNTVVKNEWILYNNQTLPSDVVLIFAYTKNVLVKEFVKINYNVLLEIPKGDRTVYKNDAVFKYYSSGSKLGAKSNSVRISTRDFKPIEIIKTPQVQMRNLQNEVKIPFDIIFIPPFDTSIYESFLITDFLDDAVRLIADDCFVYKYPNVPVDYKLNYDEIKNKVEISFKNCVEIANTPVIIRLITRLVETTKIRNDPVYLLPILKNKANLIANNDPKLLSDTQEALVIFTIPPTQKIPIYLYPINQNLPKENLVTVNFTSEFVAPAETRVYESFTIKDTLHQALKLNESLTTVLALPNNNLVAFKIWNDSSTNLVTITILNNEKVAAKKIRINISTTVKDINLLPKSNLIKNRVQLFCNENLSETNSNTVNVIFNDLMEG